MSSPTEGLMETMSAKLKTLTVDMSAETVDTIIAVMAIVAVLAVLVVVFWFLRKISALVVKVALGKTSRSGGDTMEEEESETPVVAQVAGNAWMNAAGITHPAKV